MERADFIHLVRLSEQASARNSQAYRRSVAAFAALGYAWVMGCLLLAGGILFYALSGLLRGQLRTGAIWAMLAAAGLLWTSLRALWCRLEEPEGVLLSPADAPALFKALDRIRAKIKGPPIHRVRLDAVFNASIRQHPRFGLFGGAVNHLTIGLPLLMALDRPRFLAVLAHEYGHLRGDHGRFAAWIYRTRLSWAKLDDGLRDDSGAAAVATQAFLRWYFPRFSARTFALARQDEYEADRISGKLVGKENASAALSEIAVKGRWLGEKFWPAHWSAAGGSALPIGPYAAMSKLLALPPPDDFARATLRQALREISDVSDTHPVLRDRLEALGASRRLPAWSAKPALDLLEANGARWIAQFDKDWCRSNASDWKEHHAFLGRVQGRVRELAAGNLAGDADRLVEWADLQQRLQVNGELRRHYENALQIAPGHAGALRGLILSLSAAERTLRLELLGQLFDGSMPHRWWACRAAVAELEEPGPDGQLDEKALKLWRERFKQASDAEDRACEELTHTPYFQSISRHDLNKFEEGEVRAVLARCRAVTRAWLVRKNLRESAYRRCYLLFVELPGLQDDERHDLCRELERALDLPGPVLALWAGHSPTIEEIARNAFEPIHMRGAA